jgi:aromatic-L-amino-acid/L-tryptophan decarboxylase
MHDDDGYHMTPRQFRRLGREVVDRVADYMEQVEQLPVQSSVKPGEVRAALPHHAPYTGEPFEHVLRDVSEVIMPGLTHWQSPHFFAYFPANTSGPSILADLLCAGLGVQGMLWSTSPAATELETHVLDWLVEMLQLPDRFRSDGDGGGVIQDTASSATLCALLAARERTTGFHSNADGVPDDLVAYASAEAHSSVDKAVRVAGIGDARLRRIPVDGALAMRADALAQAVTADLAAGLRPCFCVATVGTTSTHAMDPVPAIGEICAAHGIWLHVDAAMAGTAALCPDLRFVNQGLERADSYCFNPHKWMFTGFDCDCFYVADRAALIRTLSVLPEYLRNRATDSGAVIDYRDWHIPLGRRFRALKLWFVIRHYGVEGLRHHVREHIRLAGDFARWVEADERFELVVEPRLNLVCFRHRGGDEVNETLLDALNRSGRLFLTHTRVDGALTLRLCVGQTHTTSRHVVAAWEQIRAAADELAVGARCDPPCR